MRAILLALLVPAVVAGQSDTLAYSRLKFRYIGPEGNRISTVTGVIGNPNVIYAGAASGGVFKRRPIGPAPRLVNRDDARVLEPRGDQRLAQEANLVDVAARDQLLDRDVAPELAVMGARHSPEAAATVLAHDVVALGVAVMGAERRAWIGARLAVRPLVGTRYHRRWPQGARRQRIVVSTNFHCGRQT